MSRDADRYVQQLLDRCRDLEARQRVLEQDLAYYRNQERLFRSACGVAESVRARAEIEAKAALERAGKEAASILRRAEEDARAWRERTTKSLEAFEREVRGLAHRFYALASVQMQALEETFLREAEVAMARLGLRGQAGQASSGESRPFPPPAAPPADAPPPRPAEWARQERSLLIGQALRQAVRHPDGRLAAPEGTVVTPELIQAMIGHGLYGELITAVAPPPTSRRPDLGPPGGGSRHLGPPGGGPPHGGRNHAR